MCPIELQFRAFAPCDAVAIAAMAGDASDAWFFSPSTAHSLSSEAIERLAAQRLSPTTAWLGDNLVAYANFIEVGSTCSLGNLIVAPAYRRRGIASTLLRHMEALAHLRHRAGCMALSCFRLNHAGKSFFKHHGYQLHGTRAHTSPCGEAHLLDLYSKSINMKGACQ